MSSEPIIVKVGNKSNLKFSHARVFRAITCDELSKLHLGHSDCHIVVIEGIAEKEEDSLKEFIVDFKKNKDNKVFFFIPDVNDEITAGVADELDYSIFMTLKDLYRAICSECGVQVSTLVEDKIEFKLLRESSLPDGVTDIFGESSNENKEESIEVKNSVTAENLSQTYNNREENKETAVSREESSGELNIDRGEDLYEKNGDADYNSLVDDIKRANGRIEELKSIVEAVTKREKETVERFNSIVETAVVIEEPIPLSKYESLLAEVDKYKDLVKELEVKRDNLSVEVKNKSTSIKENSDTITDLHTRLADVNKLIESGDIHLEVVNRFNEDIDILNKELEEKEEIERKLLEENSDLQLKLENIQIDLDGYTEYREQAEKQISRLTNEIKQYSIKIKSLEESEEELKVNLSSLVSNRSSAEEELEKSRDLLGSSAENEEKLRNELQSSKEIVERLTVELESTKKKLKSNELNTAELNSSLSDNKIKLEAVNNELGELKLMYEAEKSEKEKLKLDSANVVNIENMRKSLEEINKTLVEKLSSAGIELENAKRNRDTVQNEVDNLKMQNRQLNEALRAISSTSSGAPISGNVNNLSVNNIRYSGSAKIITVFGSGNYGVTSTAVSIAYKILSNAKVLYMDLDLVSPEADRWLGKQPVCNGVPGINDNDIKKTGAGLFYELGTQTVIAYLDKVIKSCVKSVRGSLDYFSGAYYKIDNSKKLNGNYTELFNILGSKYDYIVVDMGRIGSGEINDSLIREITRIGSASIAICRNDISDVRSIKNKMISSKIESNKVNWLLNMSTTTAIDNNVKQIVGENNLGLSLLDNEMVGQRTRLAASKINKTRFDEFFDRLTWR
jgi:hypothetical protein